jgi:hypothetical protein
MENENKKINVNIILVIIWVLAVGSSYLLIHFNFPHNKIHSGTIGFLLSPFISLILGFLFIPCWAPFFSVYYSDLLLIYAIKAEIF